MRRYCQLAGGAGILCRHAHSLLHNVLHQTLSRSVYTPEWVCLSVTPISVLHTGSESQLLLRYDEFYVAVALRPGLLVYWSSWLDAGCYPADLGHILAWLGLTLAGWKGWKGDELTRSGPSCLWEIFFIYAMCERGASCRPVSVCLSVCLSHPCIV